MIENLTWEQEQNIDFDNYVSLEWGTLDIGFLFKIDYTGLLEIFIYYFQFDFSLYSDSLFGDFILKINKYKIFQVFQRKIVKIFNWKAL